MNIISLIQPHELGPDFFLDDGIWKVNFPTVATPPPPISNDARNIIQNVGDGMYVDQRDRLAYAMVQDNQTQKIQLWQFPADEVFDINTATMVSEIDMLAMNGQFDDIAIDEGVVTFTDVQTGLTLTLNTNELQRVGSIKSTNTVTVTETAGVLKLTAKIDPKANNLLEVTAGGLQVSPDKIENIFNAELAKLDVHTQSILPDEGIGLKHVIGDHIIDIPKVMLANSAGVGIALVNDPNALEMSRRYEYPFEVKINNNLGLVNNTSSNFSIMVDGVQYLASKPQLTDIPADEIHPDVEIFCWVDSNGVITFNVASKIENPKPMHFVFSPSEAQKVYSNKFLEQYRSAKVLPNGDFSVTMLPYMPA